MPKDPSPLPEEEQPQAELRRFTPFKIVLGYGVLGLILTRIWWAEGWELIKGNWIIFTIVFAALLAVAFLIDIIPKTRAWSMRLSKSKRIGLIFTGLLPVLVLSVAALMLLPDPYNVVMARGVFLIIVTLLPAVLYYLFVARKRGSIINDFLDMLNRFGLTHRYWNLKKEINRELKASNWYGEQSITDEELDLRLSKYFEKFEAINGRILVSDVPKEFHDCAYFKKKSSPELFSPVQEEDTENVADLLLRTGPIAPVFFATILIFLGWIMILPPWPIAASQVESAPQQVIEKPVTTIDEETAKSEVNPPIEAIVPPHVNNTLWTTLKPTQSPPLFAFLGAYFFSLQWLFRRYVRSDLNANAYVSVSQRIILSVVGIWVVTHAVNLIGSKPANLEALLILGFIVGVFPATIWEFVTKASRKIGAFVIKLPNIESRFPLSELDGLTVWHQARLEEEDIENIPNVATADIIGLVLSTRIPPQRIIDWVDQSILVFNLGQADATNNNQTFLEKLREHGIRTASALLVSYDNVIDSPNFGENEKSKVKTLCDTFLTSSNILLVLTWRGMAQHSMSPADTSP